MVSLKDATKIFNDCETHYHAWRDHHDIVTATNLAPRLSTLKDNGAYKRFCGDDDTLCAEVYGAQLQQLEKTWQEIRLSM
jgi:hypothetical protein